MTKAEAEEIKKRIDNVIDEYCEELLDSLEKRKDIQSLHGWMRLNIHKAVEEACLASPGNRRFMSRALKILIFIGVLNLLLLSLRYVFDPI